MRYIASKFPAYTFEALLDKSMDWLNWAVQQAVLAEADQYKRIAAMLGFDGEKKDSPGQSEEDGLKKLAKWGIG